MKIIIYSLFCSLVACGDPLHEAEIFVNVMNDSGKPLPGAEVVAWFPHVYGAGASPKGDSQRVIADQKGMVKLKGKTAASVSFGARMNGFYETSGGQIDFIGMINRGQAPHADRNLILKKIENPIPLYSRQLRDVKIPALNAPFGFDLEAGDWVAPHGKGKTSDMIFQINGNFTSYREHDLKLEISFPNEGDGLIEFEGSYEVGSALRSDHLAPESGYKSSLVLRRKALYEQKSSQWLNDSKPGNNYYLRLRTVLDENGNVIRANFGKIYGNFEFLDYIKAEAYYFNPIANDRNVEFDTKRNLATPLKSFDKVLMP